MSHSNQCECAICQTKMDTEQDETRRIRSLPFPVCVFDDHPATTVVQGMRLCATHAICNTCLKPLIRDALMCRCVKNGYTGHAELLWCSEACLNARHPKPDQTAMDTQQDEARKAHGCFFDDQPATALLNGIYLCPSHAICSTCLKPLTHDGLICRCEKYGYSGHEELLWCSEACLEARHPEPDRYDQEEQG